MSDAERAREQLGAWLRLAPVVPIVTLESAAHAVAIARALVAGGLPVIEVTLRTPVALECIREISREVDGAVVGAGTLLSADQVEAARRAGAQFGVAPGASAGLLCAVEAAGFPFLPGACTPSEVMALRERGYRIVKFFPASVAGGTAWLRAVAAPLPDVQFCATGGIDAASARSYLELPNVVAVGGSWLAARERVAAQDWQAIEVLARSAATLRNGG